MILEELKEPIERHRLAVTTLGGFGPEPIGLLVFAQDFQVLFEAIAKVERLSLPEEIARGPAFRRLRTVCGVADNARSGGKNAGLLDQMKRKMGVLRPRTSINTAPGVSPAPEVSRLRQVGDASVRAAIGPVDYEVVFNRDVSASDLLQALYDVRETTQGRLDRLETVASVRWSEEAEAVGAGWHESHETLAELREIQLPLAEAASTLDELVNSQAPDLPSVVEAVTFMLERGYIFFRNKATAHLVEDLLPFLKKLCADVPRIGHLLKQLQSWSRYLGDADAELAEGTLGPGEDAGLRDFAAVARVCERTARDEFARMCRSIRLRAPLFARALRQRASGSFPHLFDANVQARADTHFGSFRLFIAAAQGLVASLYRAAGQDVQPYTGFVTCGTEHDVMTHPGRIVDVPFHLLRRPETFHVLGHEFGHHLDDRYKVQKTLSEITHALGDVLPGLRELFLGELGPEEPEARPRTERIRQTVADIVWCVAASEKADGLRLRGFPRMIAHFMMHYDQLVNCPQVVQLVQRALCVYMTGRFHEVLGDHPDSARVRELVNGLAGWQGYEDAKGELVGALSGQYRRLAQDWMEHMELGSSPGVSQLIEEAALLSYLLSPEIGFGPALARIVSFGPEDAVLNAMTEAALGGKVLDELPPDLPGARLSWAFDKASKCVPEKQGSIKVPYFNARLAMALILAHLT
ncbi:MAG: hypothetical protein FJ291_30160 [Planctomycetes bacterium]|nr:hypothetical protein [Planctomycetota bacterium]